MAQPINNPISRRRFSAAVGIAPLTIAFAARATPENGLSDAKNMVNAAVAAIENAGWPNALQVSPPDTWLRLEDDLYIFVLNVQGVVVFHPDSSAIGVDVSQARDISGSAYIQNLLSQMREDGNSGVVEYVWPRPSDGKMRLKRTYAKRIGDLIVACGIYVEDI